MWAFGSFYSNVRTRAFPRITASTLEPCIILLLVYLEFGSTNMILISVLFEDADTGRQYTFSKLKYLSSQFGQGLRSHWRWARGDVMAVYSPNCIDLPAVIFGTLWAGGVISSVNPTYTVNELSHQIKDSGAKALITHASCFANTIAAAKNVGIPRNRVLLVGDGRVNDAQALHFTELLDAAHRVERVQINPIQDCAFLSYSSGKPRSLTPTGLLLCYRVILCITNWIFTLTQHQPHRYFRSAKGCGFITRQPRVQCLPGCGSRQRSHSWNCRREWATGQSSSISTTFSHIW